HRDHSHRVVPAGGWRAWILLYRSQLQFHAGGNGRLGNPRRAVRDTQRQRNFRPVRWRAVYGGDRLGPGCQRGAADTLEQHDVAGRTGRREAAGTSDCDLERHRAPFPAPSEFEGGGHRGGQDTAWPAPPWTETTPATLTRRRNR